MRGSDSACLFATHGHDVGTETGWAKGQRAREPTTRFGWQAAPPRHGEAAELTARQYDSIMRFPLRPFRHFPVHSATSRTTRVCCAHCRWPPVRVLGQPCSHRPGLA
jgi:hypothetical protein